MDILRGLARGAAAFTQARQGERARQDALAQQAFQRWAQQKGIELAQSQFAEQQRAQSEQERIQREKLAWDKAGPDRKRSEWQQQLDDTLSALLPAGSVESRLPPVTDQVLNDFAGKTMPISGGPAQAGQQSFTPQPYSVVDAQGSITQQMAPPQRSIEDLVAAIMKPNAVAETAPREGPQLRPSAVPGPDATPGEKLRYLQETYPGLAVSINPAGTTATTSSPTPGEEQSVVESKARTEQIRQSTLRAARLVGLEEEGLQGRNAAQKITNELAQYNLETLKLRTPLDLLNLELNLDRFKRENRFIEPRIAAEIDRVRAQTAAIYKGMTGEDLDRALRERQLGLEARRVSQGDRQIGVSQGQLQLGRDELSARTEQQKYEREHPTYDTKPGVVQLPNGMTMTVTQIAAEKDRVIKRVDELVKSARSSRTNQTTGPSRFDYEEIITSIKTLSDSGLMSNEEANAHYYRLMEEARQSGVFSTPGGAAAPATGGAKRGGAAGQP